MTQPTSLIKFQIGPVQDFIAAARSTRDLWSGSYLLSWLVAAGIRKLSELGGELIFPNPDNQPLLELKEAAMKSDHSGLLTPNLPNIFIATLTGDAVGARRAAKEVEKAIHDEWKAIAESVKDNGAKFGFTETGDRFKAQVDRHLSISWQVTPIPDDSSESYASVYRRNGWHLDAVRQTREFKAWNSGSGRTEKDSLTGREEALIGGTDFQSERADNGGEYGTLFAKHADYLGAASVIKRCWHLAFLRDWTKNKPTIRAGSRHFNIRSIPAIAARRDDLDDERPPGDSAGGDKYIAAIAFDGDSIGKWVNGDYLDDKSKLAKHHRDFSAALSHFAMNRVRAIVEKLVDGHNKEDKPIKVPLGQLIYAGGDDVVALLPADAAIQCAADLREAFRDATHAIEGADNDNHGKPIRPDASAGIAIGHIHAPLQDLIREAQKAEKRAKNTIGRPAFSITLMKRSGEISHWGSRWEDRGYELYHAIAERLAAGHLSAKFPHRVIELLEPYLIESSPLIDARSTMENAGNFDALPIIQKEFSFAVERQSASDKKKENWEVLENPLHTYLDLLERHSPNETNQQQTNQRLLTSVIGLCTTVAFADRNRDKAKNQQPAEKQSIAQ